MISAPVVITWAEFAAVDQFGGADLLVSGNPGT
jgi:hypothetical protein